MFIPQRTPNKQLSKLKKMSAKWKPRRPLNVTKCLVNNHKRSKKKKRKEKSCGPAMLVVRPKNRRWCNFRMFWIGSYFQRNRRRRTAGRCSAPSHRTSGRISRDTGRRPSANGKPLHSPKSTRNVWVHQLSSLWTKLLFDYVSSASTAIKIR